MNQLALRIANLIGTIAMQILSYTSFAGSNVGAISARRSTWLTPSGTTFAIWGVINMLLVLFAIMQILPASMLPDASAGGLAGARWLVDETLGPLYVASAFCYCLWLLVWPLEAVWISFIVICSHAIVLGAIYLRIQSAINALEASTISGNLSESAPLLGAAAPAASGIAAIPYILIVVPITIYFAWVTCATLISIFVTFMPINKDDPVATIPASIVGLVAIAVVGMTFLILYQDMIAATVVVWALYGVSRGPSITRFPVKSADALSTLAIYEAGLIFISIFISAVAWYTGYRRSVSISSGNTTA